MKFTIPGPQAVTAFIVCRDTPTKDPDFDVHIEIMQKLRDHAEAQEGKKPEQMKSWAGDLKKCHVRYIRQCRDEVGLKGFADIFVEAAYGLKETLSDMLDQIKHAEEQAAKKKKAASKDH